MQVYRDGDRLAVKLEAGEEVHPTLTRIVSEAKVTAGFVVFGLGMVKDVTLGYYDGTDYRRRTFPENHELLALHGSVATVDGQPHLHLHLAMSGPDFLVHGGHLFQATVDPLIEAEVEIFSGHTFRRPPLGPVLRALDLCSDEPPRASPG